MIIITTPPPSVSATSFRTLVTVLLLLVSPLAVAEQGIDAFINNAVQPLTTFISSVVFYSVTMFGSDVPLVVAWLVFAAVFFTFYFNFLNFRGFSHAISLVRGNHSNPKDKR